MTCVGHIVHLWPKFAPERSEGANDDKGHKQTICPTKVM